MPIDLTAITVAIIAVVPLTLTALNARATRRTIGKADRHGTLAEMLTTLVNENSTVQKNQLVHDRKDSYLFSELGIPAYRIAEMEQRARRDTLDL